MKSTTTFAQILRSPGIPNSIECELLCQKCNQTIKGVIRGIVVSIEGNPLLGDLRCSSCQGTTLELLSEERALLEEVLEKHKQSKKALPTSREAFLRSGDFFWFQESFSDPRTLRDAAEEKAEPDDAEKLFRSALAMLELRDLLRAKELLLASHEKSPDSPQPIVVMADITRAFGEEKLSRELAKEALQKKDGPLLIEGDRTALLSVAARLASTAEGEKIPKVGRNDPCPCGSGKKYKKCCGG